MDNEYILETCYPPIEVDEKGNLPIMTVTQKAKAVRIIRDWCSNYDREQGCLPLGCPCVQCGSFTVLCKHFRHTLLRASYIPGAKQLETELFRGKPVKICKECGRPFMPSSNRARYCSNCSARVHRRNAASSARKRRQNVDR